MPFAQVCERDLKRFARGRRIKQTNKVSDIYSWFCFSGGHDISDEEIPQLNIFLSGK